MADTAGSNAAPTDPGIVVVTGCSSGIGLATAVRFAQGGAKVHATLRDPASGDALRAASEGLAVEVVVMDVTDTASVQRALGGVLEAEGRIDVLVNNAGVSYGRSVEETPLEDHLVMMDTNAWGTLRCIQAVLPDMRQRRSGTIVNVTSLTGRMVMGGHAAYSMSKAAAEALTENLAIEMVPFGVRVAAVEPGLVRTPLVRKAPPPAEPGSPYAPLGERAGLFYPAIYRNTASSAAQVAEVVWEAATTDRPRLRWIAGVDAEALLRNRAAADDDEYVARTGDPDLEQWRRYWSALAELEL